MGNHWAIGVRLVYESDFAIGNIVSITLIVKDMVGIKIKMICFERYYGFHQSGFKKIYLGADILRNWL